MNIRLTEEGKYFEVHSFNRSQITLKVIFLLGKIKDFSFKLNFQLRLIGMDIGIDRLGKESNLKSAFINFLPFNFQPYTLTGNYLRFLGKSSAAKILVKIGDFGLIIRALTLSSIIDDKKAATNLSTLSNFNRKK